MFNKFDTICGKVVSTGWNYSLITSEEEDAVIKCRSFLPVGTTGYFTVVKYIIADKNTYFVDLDSITYDAA